MLTKDNHLWHLETVKIRRYSKYFGMREYIFNCSTCHRRMGYRAIEDEKHETEDKVPFLNCSDW